MLCTKNKITISSSSSWTMETDMKNRMKIQVPMHHMMKDQNKLKNVFCHVKVLAIELSLTNDTVYRKMSINIQMYQKGEIFMQGIIHRSNLISEFIPVWFHTKLIY